MARPHGLQCSMCMVNGHVKVAMLYGQPTYAVSYVAWPSNVLCLGPLQATGMDSLETKH